MDNEKDAARYRWWKETGFKWLESDDDGLAGLAYACQLDLNFINKASEGELADAIADYHLQQPSAA